MESVVGGSIGGMLEVVEGKIDSERDAIDRLTQAILLQPYGKVEMLVVPVEDVIEKVVVALAGMV